MKTLREAERGIDEVPVEMLVMVECAGVRWTRRLLSTCMREGREDPRGVADGLIVPICKRKGDFHEAGKYPGITLLSHVKKVLQRIVGGRIWRILECEM